MTDWVKFGIGDLHVMLLGSCGFRENRRSESHAFFNYANDLLFFHIYCPLWVQFGIRELHIPLFRVA
jgi:hypothetical protein